MTNELHDTFETVEHVLYIREHVLLEHARRTLGTTKDRKYNLSFTASIYKEEHIQIYDLWMTKIV